VPLGGARGGLAPPTEAVSPPKPDAVQAYYVNIYIIYR
jgi:hypothetical protein